jgi:hypothetical protein
MTRKRIRKERGFISTAILPYLAIGAGVVIFRLWGWGAHQSSRADSAIEERARVEGEFNQFKTGVRRAGEKQLAENAEKLKKEKRIADERYNSLLARYNAIDAKFNGMRDNGNSGGRPVSSVPETARPVDDSARDSRLLEVLRHAEKQTAQLIELQEWVRQQYGP